MKKALIISAVLIVLINLFFIFFLSIPLWRVGDAMRVSTGLGAKLACSGTYLSGFDQTQNVEDLASYSPATRINNLVYNQQDASVTADFWGMAAVTARFVPDIGCYLDFGDSRRLQATQATRLQTLDAAWPAGERVETIDADMQVFLDEILTRDNQQGLDTRALLVVNQGEVIAEAYKPGIQTNTPLLGWSMGKSITAMMLGHLELKGKVNIEERSLFTEWMQDERAQISLQDLLQMSSGLDFDELYLPGSDSTRMLFMQHSASDYAMKSELGHLPGSHFAYSSGTTNLLARILFERLGGTPEQAYTYLYQDFFAPLGITHSWFEPDASGVFVGSSYPYMSGRDWARLAQLLLNKGELNGQRLLSEDWVERAVKPNSSENDARYGYQFWLNTGGDKKRWGSLPADMYAMHGNRYQFVAIFPSQQLAVIRLGWSSSAYPEDSRLAEILERITNNE